ncbi:hypothetical protein GCM10027084_14430 [Pseudoxanthomonas sangjuensis]|uniref:porin n=1 Tax=Pseudoxanthomonas sangjuensis TaxID=1503750 RepID=UPI0013907CCE|nr:porin [Pseudoxanthomonas sangjuensis]KAF1715741.1 porin [Pseudoxanthomonas sangjuensis]
MRSNLLATAIAASLGLVGLAATDVAHAQSSTELAELKAQIAALQAKVEDLESRADAQSEVNVEQAKVNESVAPTVDSLKKLVNDTKLSGRMYFDLTNIDQESNGAKTDASGFGFDIKRFYLGVDHKFDDVWSMNLTTDFQYSSAISSTELYIKKAYIQAKLSDAFVLRAGSTDLPWVPFAENYYGMRYVENTIADRLKFATSADWGLHVSGEAGSGMFNYAAAMLNGAGYKNPSRSKGVDFEGRIGFAPTANTVVAVGAYSGKLGKEKENTEALHTADRVDAMVAYASPNFRVGAEYFQAKNWNNVLTAASDKADGYSVWSSVGLTDGGVTLFGRYDKADLSKEIDPSLEETYYNLGVEFPVIKGVKLATVYKYTHRENDTTTDQETKEFGVWGEFRF